MPGAKKTLAQAFREGNSKNRFVNELKANEDKIFNSSFDSAYSCLSKRRHLKQTQICVRRSLKRPSSDSFTTVDKLETKTELFLMPMPKKTNDPKIKLNATSTAEGGKPYPHSETNDDFKTNNVMNNVQRNMRAFVGNVDFVVNTLKLYPTINALWDVYGMNSNY